MTTSRNPPWKKRNPRKARGQAAKALSPSQKETARQRAKAAGRPYPNLVDNMYVARKSAGASKKQSHAKKRK
ncbi:MAG: hypothetical protein ABWY35_02575 [Pseudorhodoplanes sp.]